MYLSRLRLNPLSRQVQRETADPYNLHRTIMSAFGPKRDQAGVLHRMEVDGRTGAITLLAQSLAEPDWSILAEKDYLLSADPFSGFENPAVKQIDLSLQAGQTLRFRLVANPTVKRDGKRHPLYKEEDQRRWLETKATGSEAKKRPGIGCRILDVRLQKLGNQRGYVRRDKEEGHKLTLHTVQFDGRLQVTDPVKLLAAIKTGIGPAKAFGCGLLSLAPG